LPYCHARCFPAKPGLRAGLRFDEGAEHIRFEVKSVTQGKVDQKELFQPPPDYTEIPLPF
jgi:hypothetical protein